MTVQMLKLPTNFGIHHLRKETNNNMRFIMKNGKKFGASSLMLGIHSPILLKNYIEPGILDVEVEEFAQEVVVDFVEAMYTGDLVLQKDNFRDMNKICHVFRVEWMTEKCFEYFKYRLAIAQAPEMIPLFDEALFSGRMLKEGCLLDMFLTKYVNSTKKQLQAFLKAYLAQTDAMISESSLICITKITEFDQIVIISHLKERAGKDGSNEFNKLCLGVLQQIDLVECVGSDGELVVELFDVLLEREGIPEWNEINNLYRKVTKEFIKQTKLTKISSNSEEEVDDMPVLEVASGEEECSVINFIQRLQLNESDSGSDESDIWSDESDSGSDESVSLDQMIVDRACVGKIIGKGGSRIREIQDQFDVKIGIVNHPNVQTASILQFHRGESVNIIAACCYIEEKITGSRTYQGPGDLEETESSASEDDTDPDQMIVDRACVGKIIGKGGSRIREIQDQFDVKINIVNHPIDQTVSILQFYRGEMVDILAACRHIGKNIL